MKLTTVVDPTRLNSSAKWKSKVHYQQPGEQRTMCRHPIVKVVNGIGMQQYYECDLPMDCIRCREQLEMGIRERLHLLTTGQLEDLLALTNGHLWPSGKDNDQS